uniref:Ig-like domain-containing protein n=1 Tax=Oreochromis aureus TaxID=47969 RepID=A0AAZ1XU01_OREAU
MTLICVLIWTLLCCCFTGKSRGQITVTQPGAESSAVGGTVSIKCRTSQNVFVQSNSHCLAWFQQKDEKPPRRFIYYTSIRDSGIPARFTGSGSNSDFTLTISGVQAEDAAVYYCQSYHSPYVFTQGRHSAAPRVLPPSSEELQQGTATITCLANKGFPSDWSLSWKVDGSGSISWEESRSPVVLQNDGLYSWSSTLRFPADRWMKVGSVTCEATQGCQTLVSEPLRRVQCSQS